MMTGKTLVLGATGTVGSALVSILVGEGHCVRAASRKPNALKIFPALVEPVVFDFESAETFASALDGVERVFLMARPGDDDADKVAFPLIDEMKRRGVSHVVNLSALGAERREDFALGKIERYLAQSGMAFTHLRPNFFMQIFSSGSICADIRSSGAMHIPAANARLSFIDARDIAAVAACAFDNPEHRGKGYDLTGAASLSHDDIAETISTVTKRKVHYVPLSDEQSRLALSAAGFSVARIDRLLGFYSLVRKGMCEAVSLDLQRVLGRSATSFAQFALDHAECWSV